MSTRGLEVIEVAGPIDRLRCYVAGGDDAPRRVKARLFRRGRVVRENEFLFEDDLPVGELLALLENAMKEVAELAGGRLRTLRTPGRP